MDIYISRNNQTHGPYPREVVEEWIDSGKLNRYDLACTDGSAWQPVGKLLWPEQFAKAGRLTGKQWAWIIAAVFGFVVLATVTSHFDNQQKASVTMPVATPSPVLTPKDLLEAAKNHIESYQYDDAIDKLQRIPKDAPEYKQAQSLIPVAQQKLEDRMVEKRRNFASEGERQMLDAGYDMYVTVSGPKATTVTFKYVLMSRVIVYQIMKDGSLPDRLRRAGFKKIIFTDGYYSTWSYPL